jgi:hypothetical protein
METGGRSAPVVVRVAIVGGPPDPAVHLNHFLQAMGRPVGEETQTVAPLATGFFDLVQELKMGRAETADRDLLRPAGSLKSIDP